MFAIRDCLIIIFSSYCYIYLSFCNMFEYNFKYCLSYSCYTFHFLHVWYIYLLFLYHIVYCKCYRNRHSSLLYSNMCILKMSSYNGYE